MKREENTTYEGFSSRFDKIHVKWSGVSGDISKLGRRTLRIGGSLRVSHYHPHSLATYDLSWYSLRKEKEKNTYGLCFNQSSALTVGSRILSVILRIKGSALLKRVPERTVHAYLVLRCFAVHGHSPAVLGADVETHTIVGRRGKIVYP